MHGFDEQAEALAGRVLDYARDRLRMTPAPLDAPRTEKALAAAAGVTVTPDGLGGEEALRRFTEVLAPACISVDHPRFLSFIPCAPTESATLFDLVVGASSIYAGTWLEGAGAVHAENEALRWLAGLAGLPDGAGGVFVPGGTVGNLSALVAARHRARNVAPAAPAGGRPVGPAPGDAGRALRAGRPGVVLTGGEAHSSVAAACDVMDADLLTLPVDRTGRLTGAAVADALAGPAGPEVIAVVATAGTTNLGVVDDLDGVGRACAAHGTWFHVDGAYGLAGLVAPSVRRRFAGIERADSFIVDPHKWLFAPFDCCALVYRDPASARAAHTQRAGYLDVVTESGETNPSDYAVGLSRRARGLPFWFSLAVHGTRAYTEAVETTIAIARFAAAEVIRRPHLELVHEPELSVVAFRRLGWVPADYHAWSGRLLDDGVAFVVPTVHDGETITRFAVVNPTTTEADIASILDTTA